MSDEAKGLSKWQLALAVGAGAAAVLGVSVLTYVALRSGNKEDKSHGQALGSRDLSSSAEVPAEASGEGERTAPTGPSLELASSIKQKGNDFYKKQKYEEAIRCYQEGLSACPPEEKDELAKFHHNVAAVYGAMALVAANEAEKTDHLNSVIEACSRALKLNPRYIKALTRRLKAYDSTGRKKDALLDVTRVIILDDTMSAILGETVANLLKDISQEDAALLFPKLGPLAPSKNLVKTLVESFTWQDDLSENRLKEIWVGSVEPKQDVVTGENQEALPDQPESTEESRDLYEGFSGDPFVRAAAMFRKQQHHGIIEVLTDAVENGFPRFVPHALLLRATMYMLWRDNERALKDLTEVINTKGISDAMVINALVKKAGVHAGEPDMDKVHSCLDKCFVIDASNPDALIHRARINLESLGSAPSIMDSVLEDLTKALEIAPESAYGSFTLATAYHRVAGFSQSMQLLAQATAKFEESMKKFPNFTDGLVLYAMYLQDTNQMELAEEIMKKAAKLEPDNSTVHFTLGILSLVSRLDSDRAAACMEKAISLDNSLVQAYDTLASIEIQRGNGGRALELYDKAIQFSRTQIEMGQALVAREVIAAQTTVCKEYGITMSQLASRAMSKLQ